MVFTNDSVVNGLIVIYRPPRPSYGELFEQLLTLLEHNLPYT